MNGPPPPSSFTGYTPRLEMPIVARPPSTFSGQSEDFYQQLQVQLGITLSGPNGEFVDISLSRAGAGTAPLDATLYAMTGGFVRHYPPGSAIPSPDGLIDPLRGVLLLVTWVDDVEAQKRVFSPDMPPTHRLYYVGVDQAETATVLRLETDRMSDAALRASWKADQGSPAPPSTTHAALVDAHNLRVMSGSGSVFVDAGTPIGKAALDATAAAETYRFTLRMTGSASPVQYVSPLPMFRGAPYYEL